MAIPTLPTKRSSPEENNDQLCKWSSHGKRASGRQPRNSLGDSNRYRFMASMGAFLTAVQCNDRFIHGNSYGRVKTIFGLWLPFTITEFEKFSFWSWRIGRITATGHRITAQGDGCCELTFTMPWWASPYLVVCALALRRIERIAAQRNQSSDH